MTPEPIVLTAATDLAGGTTAERFDGAAHGGGVAVSFFLNHTAPGHRAGPHRHPYAEVFAIHDGEAEFVVDGATIAARGGQVVVVPAGATHDFTNSGERTLEMTSIHPAAEMVTEWIEEA
jgi:mannose-6-phosphate isomerase-like protein (cupin superfamily)